MSCRPRCRVEVLGLIVALGGLFVFLSHRPLWHTDLWGHLAYGRWMWEHGALPATEPFMPLAREVPIVDTAWLSQLIGYAVVSAGGVAGLQLLYASVMTGTVALLAAACLRRTRSVFVAVLACALFLAVDWRQLQVIRPQLAGLICFVALLAHLNSSRHRNADWWFVPVLFALWANLHGSFLVGLGFLASTTAGRAGDLLWRALSENRVAGGGVRSRRGMSPARILNTVQSGAFAEPQTPPPARFGQPVFSDERFRRLMLLTGLAAAAVLVNPYGWGIYGEVFALMRNPNLQALTEWWPLSWRTFEGRAFAGACAVLVLSALISRRRVRLEKLLPVVGLGIATLWHSRMIVWWGPVAAWFFAESARSMLLRFWAGRAGRRHRAFVSGRVLWGTIFGTAVVALLISPAGLSWLRLRTTTAERSVSGFTPVDVAEFLASERRDGLVFNTYEWGDSFVWRDPRMPVLLTSHAHLVPPDVWRDYLRVIHAQPGWRDVFDRYTVETIVLDKARRGMQIEALRASDEWEKVYEDRLAAVFVRHERMQPASR